MTTDDPQTGEDLDPADLDVVIDPEATDPVQLEETDDTDVAEPPQEWDADAHTDLYQSDPDVQIDEDADEDGVV